jgi:adenosine deaminase
MQVTEFIQALPKAELHLHLEGAVPWELARALALEPLPDTPPWWAGEFRFDDFDHFSQAIRLCFRHVLTSVENYQQAAQTIFKKLAAQNVRYVELSFSPRFALAQGLPLAGIVTAIRQVVPPGLTLGLFLGLNRGATYHLTDAVIEAVFATPGVDGLDLHGKETDQGPAPFADIFAQARQNGLMIKAHAGELLGPQSITDALDYLQVPRIQHGATAIQDEALLERLAAERITLDLCPTSNLKLRVVPHIAAHPIRHFHQRGIPVTVNTDDPTVFGCSLTDELHLLAHQLDFSPQELAQLQINAFQVAKMPADQKQAILTEINHTLNSNW